MLTASVSPSGQRYYSRGPIDPVPLDRSVKNLQETLRSARASGWSSLFLGPPPIADNAQNERIARLDHAYSAVAADEGVTYISTFMALTANSVWMEQVAQEDGAHPANEGYVAYARLVSQGWEDWIGQVALSK